MKNQEACRKRCFNVAPEKLKILLDILVNLGLNEIHKIRNIDDLIQTDGNNRTINITKLECK